MAYTYDATNANKTPPKPKPPKDYWEDYRVPAPTPKPPKENPYTGVGTGAGNGQSGNKPINNQPPTYDYNPYQDYIDDLNRQRRKEEEARRKAIDAGVGQLQSQIPLLERQRDDASRQAYIRSQQSQVNMPQQLAAMGATGGLSESSMMGANAAYQNTQNELTNAYQDALAGVNGDIASLKSSGELSIVENSGKYYQQLLDVANQQRQEAESRRYPSSDVQANNRQAGGIQPPDNNGMQSGAENDTATYLKAVNASRNPYYRQAYTTAEKEDTIRKIQSTARNEEEALQAFLKLGITQNDINAYYNRYGINRYYSGR